MVRWLCGFHFMNPKATYTKMLRVMVCLWQGRVLAMGPTKMSSTISPCGSTGIPSSLTRRKGINCSMHHMWAFLYCRIDFWGGLDKGGNFSLYFISSFWLRNSLGFPSWWIPLCATSNFSTRLSNHPNSYSSCSIYVNFFLLLLGVGILHTFKFL